ncbi:MAG TPA: hypothetical protein ENK16_09015 [Chromatiales bacterium]|nr:hypothetical protein [Chromatiales bacterium]
MFRNKRLTIAALFAVAIAVVFWSTSRVPALNQKAQMGLRTNFGSIAFDILLPVDGSQSLPVRVLRSTVNWAWTNWKGMTFGLLFAAAVLTILACLRRRSFQRPWLNTLSGLFIGAPLGVCVNCATPIAQGMYFAGARLETALATLVSSPTLNVIVLSMAFTLLPWELAVGNVIAALLLLSGLPWLVRWCVPQAWLSSADPKPGGLLAGVVPPPMPAGGVAETHWQALVVVLVAFLRHLLFIARMALPLMLLAGFLGALVIETIPFDTLAGIEASPWMLLGIALFATFLPVPIAFNVIVVMALMTNGLDPGAGAVLLFALAAFSIYPATVIGRQISLRLSIAMAVMVALLATGLGVATQAWFAEKSTAQSEAIMLGLEHNSESAWQAVVSVCDELPESLQLGCVSAQLRDFEAVLPAGALCRVRPAGVELRDCERIVAMARAQRIALAQSSTEPCDRLVVAGDRAQCRTVVVYDQAVRAHDIDRCRALADAGAVRACRQQYLNASLLFNPDESVCAGLAGQELADCKINASIYRIADIRDFEACSAFDDPAAREHCRYTTASSMIGRSLDASGCDELEDPALAGRCRSLVTAWRAVREVSPRLCAQLPDPALADTCRLKVADRRIQSVLAQYALADLPEWAGGEAPDTTAPAQAGSTQAPVLKWQPLKPVAGLDIASVRYRPAPDGGAGPFVKVAARDLGITQSWRFRGTDFFEPFIIGRGIASGDFNRDLWPDLALGTDSGVRLYRNVGGRFERVDLEQGELARQKVFVVALVDADADGWPDLFASTYAGGNYLLMNRDGEFGSVQLRRLPGDQRLTLAAGFADLDRDGQLDIVLGNWSSGAEKLFSPEQSQNRILFSGSEGYRSRQLQEPAGETNSVLLTDFDDDGFTDLIIGNDRMVPDLFYRGDGHGGLERIGPKDGLIPASSMFTMSLEAADFDNDLRPDLFSTDMTFARSSAGDYCAAVTEPDAAAYCRRQLQTYRVLTDRNAAACAGLDDAGQQHDCYLLFSVQAARVLKDASYCQRLPVSDTALRSLCEYLSVPAKPQPSVRQSDHIPQVQRNVLLLRRGQRFIETGRENGVSSSFWSWNAKAADLDNDGWQDIYVGNGFHFGDSFYEIQPNLLFHNRAGQGFDEQAADWGLADRINTPGYTYIDLDLDGDIDIIATGVLAPPRVYLNRHSGQHSVGFVLQRGAAHAAAIGAKLTVYYGGDDQLAQRRELRLSGGFLSFDAPVLHFGLGEHDTIDGFTVQWPDGTVSEYRGRLPAGRFYRLREVLR